jgi:AraC-like DNA-binding protein
MLPPEQSYTIDARSIVGLLDYARRLRIPTAEALEAAGLTEASLAGPETRVSHASNNTLWARLAEASGDLDFGLHFAERMTIEAFGVVGHLLVHSRTFGEGLERVVACSRILHDAGRVELERRGDQVAIFPGCRGLPHDVPRQISEFSAAAVLVLGRRVTGVELQATAVSFRHPAPPRLTEHTRVLGVCPSFNALESEVRLPAAVLDLPIADARPAVLTYLDLYARDVIARLPPQDDLVGRVEQAIAASMSAGVPGIDAIAAQLGLGSRTLQRRLAGTETSFQSLVDDVRRRYAERYLTDDRLTINEIAFLVGFSEPSNFHRAFRRWTGVTPAAFRARGAGEASAEAAGEASAEAAGG